MQVDLGTLVVIVGLSAAAPLIVDITPRIVLPVVVVEILLGILLGPPLLDWISVTPLAQLLSQFGLSFLFFLAGFDLDLDEVRGAPARLALTGWLVSVALAMAAAGLLQATGVIEDYLFVGVALTTTALGTLAPILRDNGDGAGRFGVLVEAVGRSARWARLSSSRCCSRRHPTAASPRSCWCCSRWSPSSSPSSPRG